MFPVESPVTFLSEISNERHEIEAESNTANGHHKHTLHYELIHLVRIK